MLSKIADIRQSVKNGTYLSALSLALTLPDICSQVEANVEDGNRTLYIDWVDRHFERDAFHFPIPGFETQTFAGNMCYSLRCKLFHNGNTDVTNPRLGVNIDHFHLLKPGSENYAPGFKYGIERDENGNEEKTTYIAIDYLCEMLCATAERFYNSYPDKTKFDDHSITFV